MWTGNCVLSAGTRLTNDDDHLHRSPLFIHMNETLNLLTVQLLLFRYSRSSIGPHEILYRESVLLAPTIALIICHSRHFASLLAILCNSVMNYSRNAFFFFSFFPTCCFPNSERFSSIDLRSVWCATISYFNDEMEIILRKIRIGRPIYNLRCRTEYHSVRECLVF